MKVYDVHVHSNGLLDGRRTLERMARAGVSGGSVFSLHPGFYTSLGAHDTDGRTRLNMVLESCRGCEGRLFPVLWIHPDEEDLSGLIAEAAGRGIAAFKCICNDFCIGDEKGVRMLEAVAKNIPTQS